MTKKKLTHRRTVTVSERSSRPGKSSGPTRLWAFGYEDLADLFGLSPKTVRNWVASGQLDPSDLEQVCATWVKLGRPVFTVNSKGRLVEVAPKPAGRRGSSPRVISKEALADLERSLPVPERPAGPRGLKRTNLRGIVDQGGPVLGIARPEDP